MPPLGQILTFAVAVGAAIKETMDQDCDCKCTCNQEDKD